MIKSRRMLWAGYVAWESSEMHTKFYVENSKGRDDHLGDQDIVGKIILK
jgi:hypothetical protein